MVALAEAKLAGGSDAVSTAELEQCFAVSCHLGDPCWEGASARVLGLHHLRSGDIEGAVRWITEARARATHRPEMWTAMLGAILLTEADIHQAAGDPAAAEVSVRELIAHAARARLDGLLQRALDHRALAARCGE